ncbi:MAG TPA: homoserine kinase [Terriglobales bacterium]|jgi:homoserine kinase|nr:homoserine kinase [Terriglobales bacterium]
MQSNSRSRSLRLELPATSANLGPAFDAAAIAFNLYLKITVEISEQNEISATGRDVEICRRVENHLILETYRDVLTTEGKKPIPLSLRIHNEFPIGKGFGSSAAARVAGIALAVHFGNLKWSDDRIVGEASRREHHPDNASACWMGGLTVARMETDVEAQVACIKPKGKWPLLLAVPPEPLSTEKARGVLPATYSRADTVTNVQNSMLLLCAFTQGRPDLLRGALDDRIHQPYRAPLCPLLPALQELAGEGEVLGVALSGAGPSVLVFLEPKASQKKAAARIANHLRKNKLAGELISTEITLRGARDLMKPAIAQASRR